MGIPVEEIGELAARAERPVPVSSLCAVFAESEVVSLLASGSSPAGVARGIFASLGTRVAALFAPLAPTGPAALSGGVAEISGAAELLSLYSGIPLKPLPHPRFAGAIGAARIAAAQVVSTEAREKRSPSPGPSRIPADGDGSGRNSRGKPR
jgi:activator of 2-hydroxyglutaryl-CoA dehydratase